MAKAPNPDWRNTEADSTGTSEARRWQAQDAKTSVSGMPSRRVRRRTIVIGSLLVLAIVIGWLLTYLQPQRPSCLIVVGAGYEHNLLLPHNVYGWNGAENVSRSVGVEEPGILDRWFGQGSGIRNGGKLLLAEKKWSDVWKEIEARVGKGSDGEQVILFFSMHGYADEHDVYLLRDVGNIKSVAEFNASRVPFSEVLDSVSKSERLKKKGVVLLLDVCHVQSHWPIGMLQNDFVEQLQKKYSDSINAIENLTVICSTSPGQRSWPSEERKTSVFADCVAKALHGEGLEADKRVTADTLFRYVKEEVNAWAKANRARDQIPLRIGHANPDLTTVTASQLKDAPDVAAKDGQKKDEAPKANPGTPFPDNVKSAWETWQKLKSDDAPQVYAPHYWRLYQETLLRYEQLMRAGDPTGKAESLKKKLDLLEDDIIADKKLVTALDCLGNSFSLARVLGYNKPLPPELAKVNPNDRPKWNAVLKKFGEGKMDDHERRFWQAKLSQKYLGEKLDQSAIDPVEISADLDKIAADLDVPQRPGVPRRPVEVQLVKMLQIAETSPTKRPKLFQLAVQVRILAEAAALGVPLEKDSAELYAEVSFKQMQDAIKEADILRREGEDRLVGNLVMEGDKAEAKLKEAKAIYEGIRARTQQLRKAQSLRDNIAAELPFLAVSLASLDAATIKEIEPLRTQAKSLGENLAWLTKYLEKPGESLKELNAIEERLQRTREEYHTLSKKLRNLDAHLQKNWHAFDGVLRIPPTKATAEAVGLRIDLLKKRRETSLNLDAAKKPEAQAEKVENTVEVQRELLRSSLRLYEGQIQGTDDKKNVDGHVREFLLSQFNNVEDKCSKVDDEAELQEAVGRSRVLLGSLVDQLIDERRERINPAKRLRQLRTYNLLLGLAKRTLDDHWWEPEINSRETYYVPAATAYLSAAKTLEPKGAKKLNDHADLTKRLATTGLRIAGSPSRYWTTETTFDLQWTVDTEAGVPQGGFVTYWFEAPPGNARARETGSSPLFAREGLKETPENVKQGKIPVKLHALYRGQHKVEELNVERPPPDVIVRYTPGPDKVGFAARMDKMAYGAISIVLDTSGSMRYLHPKKAPTDENRNAKKTDGETSRYDFALKGVKSVLREIPEGTPLSILTFDDDPNDKKKTAAKMFLERKRWNPLESDNVIRALEGHNLKNYSPIAGAIIKSMSEGFPERFPHPKLVVVLTDGMDNGSFDQNGNEDYTKFVRRKLREAAKKYPRTDVVVVCFLESDDKEELPQARLQFEAFTENGAFINEPKGEELGRVIQQIALRPRVVLTKRGDPVPEFDETKPVSDATANALLWQGPLKRSTYQASIRNSPDKKDVNMEPGHNILAMVKRDENGRFNLQRGIVGLQREIKEDYLFWNKKKDWLVTLLKNDNPFGESRKQIIAFEKTSALEELRQFPPGFVWLEVQTQDKKKSEKALAWGSDLVVPAPAYAVDIADWPERDSSVQVNAWYWPNDWNHLLKTLKPMQMPLKIGDRAKGLIESIRWEEDYPVGEMRPDGVQYPKRKCLVIRARYQGDEPVYIAVRDKSRFPRFGSEHKFYDRAGKSTACFYDLDTTLDEIDVVLIPISTFKDAAIRVEFPPTATIEIPDIFRGAIEKAVHGK
jgi:hypothetical protein